VTAPPARPGNLADQITYPHSIPRAERDGALEARLQKLLDQVGIGYLVSRWAGDAQDTVMTIDGKSITVVSVSGEDTKGWDAAVTWEDVLSLGEQQRMGIARLLYHGPKFGLLDECTSAVSVDAEEQLYKAAIDLGITCVTVSQRLTLPEFHAQERSHGR
jgi:ABC-type uncharacterized transport system fused permease/ATPase subunit